MVYDPRWGKLAHHDVKGAARGKESRGRRALLEAARYAARAHKPHRSALQKMSDLYHAAKGYYLASSDFKHAGWGYGRERPDLHDLSHQAELQFQKYQTEMDRLERAHPGTSEALAMRRKHPSHKRTR